MEHYAKRYKKRIKQLEDLVSKYYDANYDAKLAIQNRNGLKATPLHTGRPSLCGHEEGMPVKTYEGVCKIIENLPLEDGGI